MGVKPFYHRQKFRAGLLHNKKAVGNIPHGLIPERENVSVFSKHPLQNCMI